MVRLGVVSFLNARPLIEGLAADENVEIVYDVPSALPARLDAGEVDAALIPVIDVLGSGGCYRVISDACIGCDGETMTVRVFSKVPPDRIKRLWVDGDSHTSVALAEVLWQQLYDRVLTLETVNVREFEVNAAEAILLIGDKVVDPRRGSFAYEVDLGGAWRQHTGLPFVFAVWAVKESEEGRGNRERGTGAELAELLSSARDRGVERALEIAATQGPELGWPVELAERYLARCLSYKLDARAIEGANLFGQLCAQAAYTPPDSAIAWPEELLTEKTV